jgi:F-type H+-transporting ATPase subunit gamma
MPSLLDIRRRIRSVKNTQQLTKAMKTVSAAKLRRAQERVMSARPYADQLKKILANLAAKAENIKHPLLEVRPENRIVFVVVTADRGLCGGFNANLIKGAQQFIRSQAGKELSLYTIGRKGRDFFRKRGTPPITGEYTNLFTRLDISHAREISQKLVDMYANAEVDAVYVIYNEFKSVIQQRVAVERLLPLAQEELTEKQGAAIDYIYEQPPQEIFNRMLPRYVEILIYRALIESIASEHGARMSAMDTATRNAGELVDSLTLNMNRVRQAAITREIIEVVSGAGA